MMASRGIRPRVLQGFGSLAVLVVDDLNLAPFPTADGTFDQNMQEAELRIWKTRPPPQTRLPRNYVRVALLMGVRFFSDAKRSRPFFWPLIRWSVWRGHHARTSASFATQQLEFRRPTRLKASSMRWVKYQAMMDAIRDACVKQDTLAIPRGFGHRCQHLKALAISAMLRWWDWAVAGQCFAGTALRQPRYRTSGPTRLRTRQTKNP